MIAGASFEVAGLGNVHWAVVFNQRLPRVLRLPLKQAEINRRFCESFESIICPSRRLFVQVENPDWKLVHLGFFIYDFARWAAR